jgi:transposase InsO family protein
MRAEANLTALKMALKYNKAPDVHHSDRGSQYTYERYLELLKVNNTKISMSSVV